MERLYILDPNNYDGFVQSTMPFVPTEQIGSTKVDYVDKTFDEYNQEHGGKLIAIPWEQYEREFHKPHHKSLQKPFRETTEKEFYEMLEVLPPKKWTRESGREFFFVGECYTADLYTCFVRLGDKYYSALRSIHSKAEDLFNFKDVE